MKKLLALSLVVFICVQPCSYSAGIGGAETQGEGKFSVGVEQEFVFDRDMELDSYSIIDPPVGSTMDVNVSIDRINRTMAKLSYGVSDNLDVYAKLGSADFKGKGSGSIEDREKETWERLSFNADGRSAFAYGIGFRAAREFDDGWIIGLDGQYIRHKNKYDYFEAYENSDGDSGSGEYKGEVTFQEWQVAPYIAKQIGNLVPYLGVKYSDVRQKYEIDYEDGKGMRDMLEVKADNNVGVFIGTDYKMGENSSLNIEGRFVDETAMSISYAYRF